MKKQSFLKGTAIVVLIIAAVGCQEERLQLESDTANFGDVNPFPGGGGDVIGIPPGITSFSPTMGFSGTTVTIIGGDFDPTPAYNIVKFDGVQAQVTSATPAKLTVVVPPGATSGKISVAVSGLLGTSSSDFQVIDIPLNGLVAFYPFDGNANDITSVPSNGTVSGAALLISDRNGRSNNAYSFANGGSITMGNPAELQITGQITLSAWLYTQAGSTGAPISKDIRVTNKSGTRCDGYSLVQTYLNNGNHIIGMMSNNSAQNYYGNAMSVTLNSWQLFTITISGNTVRYYQNGVFVRTFDNGQPVLATITGYFKINGYSCSGFNEYKGFIDDVAVYNRALTDAEVTKLYQQPVLP